MNNTAWEIRLNGIVQGVGFRPFVHRLSLQYAINGWASNTNSGLTIWAEGAIENVKKFKEELLVKPPALARIDQCSIESKVFNGYTEFSIKPSVTTIEGCTFMPPDSSICTQCLSEYNDINNRRHRYLLISCAQCGPRFSITRGLPYDRSNTSLDSFSLCPKCLTEYEDIENRRYHTEAIACQACGPDVWLADQTGNRYPRSANEMLKQGCILAIKGIGGFHLACDANNRTAVMQLRKRKKRDAKPFAIMCRDVDTVKEYCEVNEVENGLLAGNIKPIVLLVKKQDIRLPSEISQGLHTLGVLIPYTAMHHSLFDEELRVIVLTSANVSDEPIIDNNEAALEKLKGIADYFLLHNRLIVNSCDDSVAAVVGSKPVVYRRSRGFVPLPIELHESRGSVLACGGDLKNTFCITNGQHAFLSQHFGDLYCYDNFRRYIDAIPYYKQITGANPNIIAYDLHPGYISTHYAKDVQDVHSVAVQHHHAHFASCMAENQVSGTTLGVICDGAGYGTDGSIWGFEFLYGDYGHVERLAHLAYLPLLGGDEAVLNPSRTALAYLYQLFGNKGLATAKNLLPHITSFEVDMFKLQLEKNAGVWLTSSCGRLFDAVSCVLGLCNEVNFEGQAAMLLESVSALGHRPYSYTLNGQRYPYQLLVGDMFEEIVFDIQRGVDKQMIGGRFHAALIEMIYSTVLRLSSEKRCRQVAFSGGVFQNRLLLTGLLRKFQDTAMQLYIQRQVPTNDGGLSLGQAVIAGRGDKPCAWR